MKKKLLSTLLIAVLVLAMSFTLVACGEVENDNAVSCKLMFVDAEDKIVAEFDINTQQKYLEGSLKELDEKEANLSVAIKSAYIETYTYNTAVYGDASNSEYVLVFSDISDAAFTNPVWGTISLDGVTYASSAVGIAELPIIEGATYIIAIRSF